MTNALAVSDLDTLEARIDAWFCQQLETDPMVAAVERGEPGERRWYVRLRGEEKDTFSVWFTLGQRTLRYETYVMPAPEDNHAAFYEHLLVRNLSLHGWTFAVGDERAIFLTGALAAASVDEAELDRILGSGWAYVERCFRPALRIGFASRFP